MIYENLSIPFRSLIILGLFLNLCIGCCLIVATLRRKQLRHVALISVLTVTSGALMILYTAEARARLRQLTVPEVSCWLCSQSFLIPVTIWLVIFIVFMYLVVQHWNFSRNTISRSSIKEGIDQISSGLCFYTDNGRVLLMNSRMNELSFLLTGQDLQNAKLCWDTISGCLMEAAPISVWRTAAFGHSNTNGLTASTSFWPPTPHRSKTSPMS